MCTTTSFASSIYLAPYGESVQRLDDRTPSNDGSFLSPTLGTNTTASTLVDDFSPKLSSKISELAENVLALLPADNLFMATPTTKQPDVKSSPTDADADYSGEIASAPSFPSDASTGGYSCDSLDCLHRSSPARPSRAAGSHKRSVTASSTPYNRRATDGGSVASPTKVVHHTGQQTQFTMKRYAVYGFQPVGSFSADERKDASDFVATSKAVHTGVPSAATAASPGISTTTRRPSGAASQIPCRPKHGRGHGHLAPSAQTSDRLERLSIQDDLLARSPLVGHDSDFRTSTPVKSDFTSLSVGRLGSSSRSFGTSSVVTPLNLATPSVALCWAPLRIHKQRNLDSLECIVTAAMTASAELLQTGRAGTAAGGCSALMSEMLRELDTEIEHWIAVAPIACL